jgi:hypothetical protein
MTDRERMLVSITLAAEYLEDECEPKPQRQ